MDDMKKHAVAVQPQEKKKLKAIVSTGQNKTAVIRRAHILLKADEGKTDGEISEILYVSEQTIRRNRVKPVHSLTDLEYIARQFESY